MRNFQVFSKIYPKSLANFRKFKEKIINANPELQKAPKVELGEDYMKEEAMQFIVFNHQLI